MPAAMPAEWWTRFDRRVLIFLLAAPALIIWLGTCTDVDLLLADAAYDGHLTDFPLRHWWWSEMFSHILLKRGLVILGLIFIGVAVWDLARPGRWSSLRRVQLRVVALCALLIPLLTATLKWASSSHCPWDLERYGGSEPYLRLLDVLPAGIEPGHCLPAGHASSALWLISIAVFFLPGRPRAAAGAYLVFLAAGMGLGWLQQLRGAHFLTHTLWSAWIACVVFHALLRSMRNAFTV